MYALTDSAPATTAQDAPTSGVLIIESMPACLRATVETLMVNCLRSESTWEVPGEDPLTAQWCTRWYKDWPGEDLASLAAGSSRVPSGIGCRQVLTATVRELEALERGIAKLAEDYCFSAQVTM